MKKHKIFIAALILGLFVILPAAAQKTEKDFQKMYTDFLKKKGYNPSVDKNGYIFFTVYDISYVIAPQYRTNPQAFNVITYIPLSKFTYQKVVESANAINLQYYGVKIIVADDGSGGLISFEIYLSLPKDFPQVFDLVISILEEAAYNFVVLLGQK